MKLTNVTEEGVHGFPWNSLETSNLFLNKDLSSKYNAKIYSNAPYAEEMYKLYTSSGYKSKPIVVGDLAPIIGVSIISENEISFQTTNFNDVYIDLSKEKKYLELISHTRDEFVSYLHSTDGKESWLNQEPVVYIEQITPYIKGSLYLSHVQVAKEDMISEISKPTSVYMAEVLDKNNGGFIVKVNGLEAFLPGSLAAANKIVNFTDLIGKEIPVMIEDYLREPDVFIVSNKKYINHILPSKLAELDLNKKYTGKITGSIKVGVFVEFDDIFTGLVHKTEMTQDIKDMFYNRDLKAGNDIEFWIKEITKDNKVILTTNDPAISFNDAYAWWLGKTVLPGRVINNFKIGTLVEFAAGQVGLIPRDSLLQAGISLAKGDEIDIIISKIDKKSRKIFLEFNGTKNT